MTAHLMPTTTHTLELMQVDDVNDRLAADGHRRVTADDLAVTGARLLRRRRPEDPATRGALPGYAVLRRLECAGPPEFPYVQGHFAADPWRPGDLVVELHTDALTALSRRLDLHHRWGAR